MRRDIYVTGTGKEGKSQEARDISKVDPGIQASTESNIAIGRSRGLLSRLDTHDGTVVGCLLVSQFFDRMPFAIWHANG